MREFFKKSILFRPRERKADIALATLILVAINIIVFFSTHTALWDPPFWNPDVSVWDNGGVGGYEVNVDGEWWRIFSSAFLHGDTEHVALNMLAIFLIGRRLEFIAGVHVLLITYFVSLLGGAAGSILGSHDGLTVGASGSLYGLMACAWLVELRSGKNPWLDGVVLTFAIALVFNFMPGVSIGGHAGGFVGGLLVGLVVDDLRKERSLGKERNWQFLWATGAVLLVAGFAATLWAASWAVST